MSSKDGRFRENILVGAQVQIVLKEDQKSGHLTKGIVEELLTNAAKHPHGIKVRLRSGKVGRVQKILSSKKMPTSK
jgi:uncharacterized repeat protein (TIGR03833 family)